MRQIETNQVTFGKATKRQLVSLVPTARTIRKIGNDHVLRDEDGKCVATWPKGFRKNVLIVIH